MKNTKTKLISSVTVLLICFAMLIGSTFAWFTDSASTGVNKIQAGNLDVQLLMWDGSKYVDISSDPRAIFGTGSIAQNNNSETLWEPGKTQVAYLAIKNSGTLDLKYKVDLNVTNPTDGKNLYEVMSYSITPDAKNDNPVTSWNPAEGKTVVVGGQTVSEMDVPLKHDETHYFALSVHMEESADNSYKEGKVEFDLTVNAGQLSSEKDSFDEAYDIGAEYPVNAQPDTPTFTVNTAAQLQAALTPTVTDSDTAEVNITDDIQLADGETWTPMDLGSYAAGIHKIVINGNGHTISNLNDALIGYCYFQGISIEINNLTIAYSNMTQTVSNGLGYGAFIASTDVCASVVLNDCHLVDSTIYAIDAAGGLIGFSSTQVVKLVGCSVENCNITGQEDAGGLAGILGYATDATIQNCAVNDTNITSSKEGTYRVGYAIGTVPTGNIEFSNVSYSGGSLTQTGNTGLYAGATATELIGRNLGNVTGDSSPSISI